MANSKASVDPESNSPTTRDSGDESEDESEVLEESPCGRWQKRREEVQQRGVPGIDSSSLAMDTEEGVEVVWNEVIISEKKSTKANIGAQMEKIKLMFDNLTQLEHPNIVKFHKYWTDMRSDRPSRVIFISEYMSSGSLKQFLKKTKKNNKTLKAWNRWCTQILSALSYLHSCNPPIIHANLTCDTVFIQHNGLIKIGAVALETICQVKTLNQEARNMHYFAPEYAANTLTPAADVYSFGMCALEMAALEIPGNGDTGHVIKEETIQKTLESLEDPMQKDFIKKCLEKDPLKRPTARELLFHTVLFEVHSLKLLAAHTHVTNASMLRETDDSYHSKSNPQNTVAEMVHADGKNVPWTGSQCNTLELDKFLEDVKNGVYPLTAFASIPQTIHTRPRAVSPELAESVKSETPEPAETEVRLIDTSTCTVKKVVGKEASFLQLTIELRMNDNMNRQLQCEVSEEDTPDALADELIYHGFINATDKEKIVSDIAREMKERGSSTSPTTNTLVTATA